MRLACATWKWGQPNSRYRAATEPIPSRDRKGADDSVALKLFRDIQCHRFALLLDDVPKSMPDVFVLPEPTCAAMPRAALTIGGFAFHLVEFAAYDLNSA